MIVNEHVELAELRAPRSVDAIVSAEKLTSPMVDTDVPEMWVEAPKNRLAKLVRSRTRVSYPKQSGHRCFNRTKCTAEM